MGENAFNTLKGFCSLCEQLSSEGAHTVKTEIMKGFLSKYTADAVMLYKMLLPKLAGRKYYMQDKQLIILFSRVIDMPEKDLREKVNKSGDISETIKEVKAAKLKRSVMTVKEVDERLTALSRVTTEVKQQAVLEELVGRCNGEDLKWLLRIIKLDLRLGAGIKCLLDALGPTAYEAYKSVSSLELVVKQMTGQAGDDGDSGDELPTATKGGILLHTPISPQLARAAQNIDDVIKRCPNTFFSEIKYDGERIQIHKKGADFTFWSRGLKPMKEDKYEGLEKHLNDAFSGMSECIWDGEILLVDKKNGVPLPFGTLGKHKKAGFTDACTCIFLFDVLQINGEIVMQHTIEERRSLMNQNCKVVTNRVMLSEMTHIKGDKNVMEGLLRKNLKAAISRGLEGLVLKDIKSEYAPGARKWIKLKKDYLKGMADSADLVVLGANWGTGNFGGLLSVFLMGCYDPETQLWKTICKVGNGHDDATIKRLNKELRPTMQPGDKASTPAWLDIHSHNVPDFIVSDPKEAPVWEVIGAEFTKSPTHTADGISLRFPRVVKIRDDKTWKLATNLPQLRAIVRTSRQVAMVKLPSMLEEEPEQDNGDDPLNDEPEEPMSPPISKAASDQTPEPMQVDNSKGSLEYCQGDAIRQVDSVASMIRIVVHCVALNSTWSSKGAMGQISRSLGDEPQEQYDEHSGNLKLGDVQIIRVTDPYTSTGELWVGSVIGQGQPKKGVAPKFEAKAFAEGFKKIAAWCGKKGAAMHVVRVEGVPWGEVNSMIAEQAASIPVKVYVRNKSDVGEFNEVNKKRKRADSLFSTPKPAKKLCSDHTPNANEREEIMSLMTEGMLSVERRRDSSGRSQGRSPTLSPPRQLSRNSNSSTSKMFENLEDILKNEKVVVSGYRAVEKETIKKRVQLLGGQVLDAWTGCTFVVCETMTELYDAVVGKRPVVTRDYINDCIKKSTKLPFAQYTYDPNGNSTKPAAETPAAEAPKAVPAQAADGAIPAIFNDCCFYIHSSPDDQSARDDLEQYIVAHDGDVVEGFEDPATCVVVLSQNASLRYIQTQHPSLSFVTPDFIWKSIEAECRLDHTAFRL